MDNELKEESLGPSKVLDGHGNFMQTYLIWEKGQLVRKDFKTKKLAQEFQDSVFEGNGKPPVVQWSPEPCDDEDDDEDDEPDEE